MGETIGLRTTLIAGAAATFAGALWIFFSPARWLKDTPEVEAEIEAHGPELVAESPLRPGPEV
jgi:hypothetical protein